MRLTNQPLYPARLDKTHPAFAASSAQIICVGDQNGFLRNAGSLIAQPTLGGTAASGTTDAGAALKFNGSSTYLDFGNSNIPTDEFTVMWGGIFDALTGVTGIVDCSNGSSNGWSLFTSGTDMYLSGNHYSGDLLASGWATGTFYHGAARYKAGVGPSIFRNGTKIASSGITLSGISNPTNPFLVGQLRVSSPRFITARFSYFYLFDRYLSDDLIKSLQVNPWQIFEAEPVVEIYPAAASGSTGTVNYTNVNDTVSASGTTTVTGSLATTNANDTCAASGSAGAVSGTVAYTNADDTSAASGTTTVTGSLAKTNANDTVSASGTTTIVGSSATTNADDTCASSGSVGNAVSGSVNYTNANDSVSASGTTTVTGSLSRTNANDTVAASGTTTVLGSSSTTNANDTLLASGIVGSVTGTVAYTNNNDTCSASGTAGSPQQGGHYGGATLDRKRKKERRHDDPDKEELRRSLENLVDGKVEQLKEEITQPEIPQEIKKQAAKIIKAYQKPGIDLTVINNDIEEIKTLLQAEIRRQQDEDEELLFMLL